jgi:hypothetical protein
MKTFKDIISELTDPTPRRQKEFVDKHTVQIINYPAGKPDQLSVKNIKKDKTKKASLHDGEDASVYEETMSDAEMKKREDIVKGMKKNKADFQKRYGDRWKSVMYATATKSAIKEQAELDEAVEVSHDRYMRSHGKKASGGEGNWMFTHKRMGDANVNDSKEVHSARGKFSDAKKSAQQWAKKHGHSTVYVMEEVALDEVSQETLRNYHAKAALDLKSKREKLDKGTLTSKDYKQGQNRVTGLNRAANKMEEVELDEANYIGDIFIKHLKTKYNDKTSLSKSETKDAHDLVKRMSNDDKKKLAGSSIRHVSDIAKDHIKRYIPGNMKKEEVEELDELKKSTLGSYIKRAAGERGHAGIEAGASASGSKDQKDAMSTMKKRLKGIKMASDRLAKESVEELDELKKSTLGSYIKKAAGVGDRNSLPNAMRDQMTAANMGDKEWYKDSQRKANKRGMGIQKAANRLAKEEYMDEAFKAGSMKLSDGSSVKVTSEEASTLNALFNQLNSSNKTKMNERLMSDSKGFNEILAFAKEAV